MTQAQFDALVTYTYNLGATGAAPVLRAAKQGDHATVVSLMNKNVYGQNAYGRPITLPGIAARRLEESAPFRPQQQPQR